jgi:transposase
VPKKKYLVTLSETAREPLEDVRRSGQHATRKVTRARMLLKAAENWHDEAIAAAVDVGRATVERTRQHFVGYGLAALHERPRPGNLPKRDDKAAARLLAEACSVAPAGRQNWTLHLLADRVVALGLAESYAYERLRRVLKKTRSKRGGRSRGAFRRSALSSSRPWKTCETSTPSRMIPSDRRSTLMRPASNCSKRRASPWLLPLAHATALITLHCCPASVRPHRAVDLVKRDAVEDGIHPLAFVGRTG